MDSAHVTILDDGREAVVAAQTGPDGRVLLAPEAVEEALGWVRKPHGWCRGDLCVPVSAAARAERDGLLDPVAFAEILDRPVATDAGVIALGVSAQERSRALAGVTAPDFTLADADGVPHSLSDLRGRKVALVFWGSWCGCRYDLPEWERRHAALAEHGFSVLSVAVDRRAADAAPWIAEAAVTHPALIDVDGVVADLYDVLNVPTVLWIDEEGRVARPHDTQFATDLFRELSGLDSGAALAALDRWVLTGDSGLSDEDVTRHTRRATATQQSARTEAALALWLHRDGRTTEAEAHFARAEQLAPEDLTIWRGTMPLRGLDPMGDEYFAKRAALTEAGIPIYRPLGDWQPA
ncbi:TlpA disulfide reductase family protein [Streptomyces sp. NBC_00347]|uniref:TlpA disulfide reductase family protein n=1 Tax=Streptomyces sp. NBC_00347 TaxID=2975721 RepID=UPI00225A3BDA|nr:TlpA disulfide reductase family protein [Streptomyces sp. NBC_00347]MCX5129787.1 TlpA family protein disulfide reductase [Streptomyces sp. NBC_00347]